MSTALEYFPKSDNCSLAKAKEHLSAAIILGKQYQTTWHSIHWNSSTAAVKKRISEKLHELAFNTYSELKLADGYLKEYVKEVGTNGLPPGWWDNIGVSVYLAISQMEKENAKEIYARQLSLL